MSRRRLVEDTNQLQEGKRVKGARRVPREPNVEPARVVGGAPIVVCLRGVVVVVVIVFIVGVGQRMHHTSDHSGGGAFIPTSWSAS